MCRLVWVDCVESAEMLQQEFVREYGPYAPLSRIWRLLSFPSLDAARKAAARGTAPVECFRFPRRRGWFLRSSDLARWIDEALCPSSNGLRLESALSLPVDHDDERRRANDDVN